MKTIISIISFLAFSNLSFAQLARIDANIKKLNNNQFTIIHGDKPMFEMKSTAALKLKNAGKRAVPKLILALEDSAKTIMAHLTLCHIYFNVATFAGPKEYMIDNIKISKYFLGQEKGEGLIISETKTNGVYRMYIEPDDLKSIITYWKNKSSIK